MVALTVGVQGMSELSTFVCRSQILYFRVIHFCISEVSTVVSRQTFVHPNYPLCVSESECAYPSYPLRISELYIRVIHVVSPSHIFIYPSYLRKYPNQILYIRVINFNIRVIHFCISELSEAGVTPARACVRVTYGVQHKRARGDDRLVRDDS